MNFLQRKRRRRWGIALSIFLLLAAVSGLLVLSAERTKRIPLVGHVLQSVKLFEESSLLPTILGFPKPFTVLLLFQNSGELRPTGGFIGTVGILELERGGVKQFWTDDVYRLDGYALKNGPLDQPPDPLSRYLGVHDWGIRDANWDPDFPSSAKLVVSRFQQRRPALSADRAVESIDAVVAITPELIAEVLGVLGSVQIEGRTFTKSNFVSELQEFVEIGYKQEGISPHQRKGIIGDIARIFFERIISDYTVLPKLFPVAAEAVTRKDIQAFAFDPRIQDWIAKNRADGALPTLSGDVLGVFDANLASYKTDTVIDRSIAYQLRGRTATVSLRYKNNGAFTWKTTRYRTYTRVYAPLGSRLLEVRGALKDDKIKDPRRQPGTADVAEEHGYTVFGAFTAIEPGRTGILEFTYELPKSVTSRFRSLASIEAKLRSSEYTLTVIKQAGTGSAPLTLDLQFDKTIKRAEPEGEVLHSHYRLQDKLERDQTISITFGMGNE